MKNEVTQRREGRVLFEPPEPLFPNLPPRRNILLIRMVAFAVFACAFLLIWGLSVSAGGGENETEPSMTGGVASPDTENTTDLATETESDTDSERQTEMNEETTLEKIENKTEQESETAREPSVEVIESDLSLAERGDSYIVNYTDKAVEIAELIDRGFVDLEESNSSAPIIMILHTHTSEGYYGGKNEYLEGVISVGDALSQKLNALGLTTLHCTVIHDGGEGNAYLYARETIETMLKIYPSIKYVIDLHRMELDADGIPIKTLSNEGLAQIRLTVSADSEGWQENLSLALELRQRLNEGGTRLCMPPTLSPSRYNSDLSLYYLMVDVGATGNTSKEAMLASEKLAVAICDTVIRK